MFWLCHHSNSFCVTECLQGRRNIHNVSMMTHQLRRLWVGSKHTIKTSMVVDSSDSQLVASHHAWTSTFKNSCLGYTTQQNIFGFVCEQIILRPTFLIVMLLDFWTWALNAFDAERTTASASAVASRSHCDQYSSSSRVPLSEQQGSRIYPTRFCSNGTHLKRKGTHGL